MNRKEIADKLRKMNADLSVINILGPERDFCLNLRQSGRDYEAYYAERGIKTIYGKFSNIEEATGKLIEAVQSEPDFYCS